MMFQVLEAIEVNMEATVLIRFCKQYFLDDSLIYRRTRSREPPFLDV